MTREELESELIEASGRPCRLFDKKDPACETCYGPLCVLLKPKGLSRFQTPSPPGWAPLHRSVLTAVCLKHYQIARDAYPSKSGSLIIPITEALADLPMLCQLIDLAEVFLS